MKYHGRLIGTIKVQGCDFLLGIPAEQTKQEQEDSAKGMILTFQRQRNGMEKPNFVVKVGDEKYHVIDWDRLGTHCNLPLNEQLHYFEEAPVGLSICQNCEIGKNE